MARDRLSLPRISTRTLRLFTKYCYWYLGRSFRSVRLANRSSVTAVNSLPLIVCLNHPSWWDPLIALTLAQKLWPERNHYAPIDPEALAKYKLFEKIGFFAVEPRTFLRTGELLLSDPRTVIWITAQGAFTDARVRPVELQTGIGHLVRRAPKVAVLPLAVEYPFWLEKYPEALARFGEAIVVDQPDRYSPREWTLLFASKLEETMERLSQDAMARREESFEVLLRGRAGVGGIYDLWRTAKARLRGRRFERAHGGQL